MTVPFAFANLSGTIALSKLDSNFNTPITIGNTSVQLGNTITTVNNLTLANVTITSGTSNVTNVNVTSINVTNLTATLANVTTLNVSSEYVTASNVATAVIGNLTLYNALTVPNGGTGRVTLPINNVLLGNGTGFFSSVAPGNAGNVLTSVGGVWVSNALVSLSVGGSNGQVQYNNANLLAGSANMTFDGTTLTAAGFSGPHNGTVGATTANTGAFTTLSASSTVSGTGFSTYLASPPAIGGTAPAAGTFTTAKAIAAATQDAVQLQGRAGGTGSFAATITPTTLTASRTLTIPDATGTILQSGTTVTVAQGGTGQTSYTDGQLLIGNSTGNTLTKATLTAGTNVTITNSAGGITIAAAGGTPGGSTTQLQYNNGGAFGGISGVTTDGTRVTASTTIGVGGATPSISGSGITFPATQSASTDANTLDDYEEGTWTPSIGGTATYNTQSGTYVKIGNTVFYTFLLQINVKGTGNNYTVTGFPFSTSGVIRGGPNYYANLPLTITSMIFLGSGAAQIDVYSTTAAANNVTSNTVFGDNADIRGYGFYTT